MNSTSYCLFFSAYTVSPRGKTEFYRTCAVHLAQTVGFAVRNSATDEATVARDDGRESCDVGYNTFLTMP